MKTIKESRKNISLIWRRPTPTQSVYRPMKYLLKAESEDGMLLYNVVTSEMVLLNDDEAKAFERLPAMYSPEMDELIAGHYLVKEEFEEEKSVLELRALLRKLDPSKRVHGFTILPTTECNARCFYCFESDHKRCTMTKEIISDVIEYIARMCKGEPVEISWFGGEPMVGKNCISQICDGLKQKEIKFKSSMVSNAYLFDADLIKKAKEEWNLRSIQITLDGTEEVYNKTKAYVNPKDNPYERVMKNIDDLLDAGIVVSVRMNVTNSNVEDLCDLIDILETRFGKKKGFSCYAHAVYEDVGFEPLSYNDSSRDVVDSRTIALEAKMREKKLLGKMMNLPSLRTANCMSDNDSCRLIYPDGTIGKCENRSSEDGIGDIYNDITNKEMDDLYKASEQIPECYDCPMFPYCMNLKLCPETGLCSKTRVAWKIAASIALMKEMYEKYKKENGKTVSDDSTQTECDS